MFCATAMFYPENGILISLKKKVLCEYACKITGQNLLNSRGKSFLKEKEAQKSKEISKVYSCLICGEGLVALNASGNVSMTHRVPECIACQKQLKLKSMVKE